MKYKLTENEVIRSDGISIPKNSDYTQWMEFLDWLAKGNIPIPEDQPFPEDFFSITK
jgi:hypothetical protein